MKKLLSGLVLGVLIVYAEGDITIQRAFSPQLQKAVDGLQMQGMVLEKSLEYMLAHTDEAPSTYMFIAALKLHQLKKIEDAAFLFFAAQLRSRYDLKRFVPITSQREAVYSGIGAVRFQVGGVIKPAIMRQPLLLEKVVKRIQMWEIDTVSSYYPGWRFEHVEPLVKQQKSAQKIKKGFLRYYKKLVTLLKDPDYFKAFVTVQKYNQLAETERTDPILKAEKEAAEDKMRLMEKEVQIKVSAEQKVTEDDKK